MCSHGYFYQGNEKQTRATLKGHYCLYYLTMSHFIKRTVQNRIRVVYRTGYRNSFFLGGGEGGRLLQILSLRRGSNSKRGAYLKLGANSSIYGKSVFTCSFGTNVKTTLKPANMKRARNITWQSLLVKIYMLVDLSKV